MDLVNLMKSMTVNDTEEYNESSFNVFAATINNVHTDIIYGDFTRNYMIIATQYEKIGCLLRITVDEPVNSFDTSAKPIYSVQLLFGSDNIEQQAAARYIAEKLDIRKNLMLFLSLKEYSIETVRALGEILLNVPTKE